MRILSPPRADCPIAQESTLPNAQARNEPVWVFVSAPEFLHTGEPVMEWVQNVCERQPWRFKYARPPALVLCCRFQVSPGVPAAPNQARFRLGDVWQQLPRRRPSLGAHVASDGAVGDRDERARWHGCGGVHRRDDAATHGDVLVLELSRQGAGGAPVCRAGLSQRHLRRRVHPGRVRACPVFFARCVWRCCGSVTSVLSTCSPVTRVECKMMPEIVQNVRVRGERGSVRDINVEIKVCEFAALKRELELGA